MQAARTTIISCLYKLQFPFSASVIIIIVHNYAWLEADINAPCLETHASLYLHAISYKTHSMSVFINHIIIEDSLLVG